MVLNEFKKAFINYIMKQNRCTLQDAEVEFEAIKDDINLDIDEPEYLAQEVMSYWVED